MKRIMCIWLPHWPIQRLTIARPELKQRGIVLHIPARQGRQVLMCDQHAEQIGVRPGMPLSEAVSLAGCRRHPLHVQAYDSYADLLALGKLAERCEVFSPIVGIEDWESAECLLLDITGLEHLFQSEEHLARRVMNQFRKWKLSIRIAVADTPGAAWAVAHYRTTDKPVIISPADSASLLELPVEGLRLTEVTLDLLHELGLQRIGQVCQLSRASLLPRFGGEVLKRLDQLFGHREESIVRHQAQAEFQERWLLEYSTTDPVVIEQIVSRLLGRLIVALHPLQRGIMALECRFCCEQTEAFIFTVKLYQPAIDQKHLIELLRLQWERRPLSGAVCEIILDAKQTAPLTWRQQELFTSTTNRRTASLSGLLERLSNRLGNEAVVRPQLRADAVPERACAYLPLVGGPEITPSRRKAKFAPAERPLSLLSKPVAIEAIPALHRAAPASMFYQGMKHVIVHHRGPERIETAWWRGPPIRRDYYRVETSTGQRFWIFQNLQDAAWFLHGEF